MKSSSEVVELLNGLLLDEPAATRSLFKHRVTCTPEFLDNDTPHLRDVVVEIVGGDVTLGTLGLLNGILGPDHKVAAQYSVEDGKVGELVGFCEYFNGR